VDKICAKLGGMLGTCGEDAPVPVEVEEAGFFAKAPVVTERGVKERPPLLDDDDDEEEEDEEDPVGFDKDVAEVATASAI